MGPTVRSPARNGNAANRRSVYAVYASPFTTCRWPVCWLLGLSKSELAFEPVYGLLVFAAILFGHVTLLAIARIFVARFGIALSAWRPFDSRFRRIAAGRDNDLAIVLLSLLLARPDRGIELVALWTLCTLVVQATRLAMANDRRSHGRPVVSWLA